jgi:hypothetical protein
LVVGCSSAGLVRSGVAPDHPEVKAVQADFEAVASDARFSYVGNCRVGVDVPVGALRSCFNAVVFAHGAEVCVCMCGCVGVGVGVCVCVCVRLHVAACTHARLCARVCRHTCCWSARVLHHHHAGRWKRHRAIDIWVFLASGCATCCLRECL